jgi:ELWxxDGT repeat protein
LKDVRCSILDIPMRHRFPTLNLLAIGLIAFWTVPSRAVPSPINTQPQQLKSFSSSEYEDLLANAVSQSNRIFFAGFDPTHGRELWVSDGSTTGTKLVKDILPGRSGNTPKSANPKLLISNGDTFWFQIDDRDRPLWQSNGSSSGTIPVTGLSNGIKTSLNNSNLITPTILNGRLLFPHFNGTSSEFWQVTPNSQPNAKLLYRFSSTQYPQSLNVMGNQVLFAVTNQNAPTQLWRSNGQTASLIAPVTPSTYAVWQNRLYMEAEDPKLGWELWTSDTTAAGTKLLKDINPGAESSAPRLLTGLNQTFFVVANTPEGEELWATQGSSETTRLVKRLTSQPSGRAERTAVTIGNQMYFAIVSADGLWYLWRTDGTEQGTQKLTPQGLIGINNLTVVGNRVFFNGAAKETGGEPWVTDGTVGGTRLVKDLYPGITMLYPPCPPPPPDFVPPPEGYCLPIKSPNASNPRSFTVVGNRVYFIADEKSKSNLWISDGTAAGTKIVLPLTTTIGYAQGRILQLPGKLLVSRFDPTQQQVQLWAVPTP